LLGHCQIEQVEASAQGEDSVLRRRGQNGGSISGFGHRHVIVAHCHGNAKLFAAAEHVGRHIETARLVAEIFRELVFTAVWSLNARPNFTRGIDRRPSENYYKRIARRKKLFLPGLNEGQHREIEVCGTRRVQVTVAEVVSCGRDKQNNVLLLHGNCVGQSLRSNSLRPRRSRCLPPRR